MAFVAPMAAAGVAGAEGAAAAGGGAAVAGTAGRGAAGKAASRTASKAGSSRAAAAGGAAGSTSSTSAPRRRRTVAERYDDRQTAGGGSTAATPATEQSKTIGEQLDAPSQAVDEAVKNSRAYVAAQKARPSQQVAGGLLAALVVYPILLNFLQGGSPQVKRWLKAKAFNVTSTPGAASSTVQRASYSGGAAVSNAGMTSGTGATSPPSSSGTSSSTGSAAGTAIAFARSKIGLPYGWGKAGPNSYDCSGLTSKAYAAAGISIGRTTLQQIFAGTEVKRADLQPGDLVFAHPRHVAIYTGNGRIVEAPRTGLNVREVPIWGFWRARRVT